MNRNFNKIKLSIVFFVLFVFWILCSGCFFPELPQANVVVLPEPIGEIKPIPEQLNNEDQPPSIQEKYIDPMLRVRDQSTEDHSLDLTDQQDNNNLNPQEEGDLDSTNIMEDENNWLEQAYTGNWDSFKQTQYSTYPGSDEAGNNNESQ